MGKNYTEYSNQIIALRTNKTTCAFYADFAPAPVERFAELITGKVKIIINDFSRGKGDNAIFTYYNLDLKDIYYLYQRAKTFYMPVPFSGNKIFGAYPIKEGPDAGMCKAFRITIKREDFDRSGNPKNCPWNITIINGVANAKAGRNQGSFYEASGSFQQRSMAYINISDIDFLEIMENVYSYIKNYKSIVAQDIIPKGLHALDEINKRGTYQEPVMQTPVMQTPVTQTPVMQTPQVSLTTLETHPTSILIQSDFQALEGGRAIAECVTKGKVFQIYFDSVPNELIEAKNKQVPVNVLLYMDTQRRFCCSGLA